jgi:acyl-CoA thioesterase
VTKFETDTAVALRAPGSFAAHIDPAWWVYRGPHGGYVAAIVMRAMAQAVADSGRAARSFTIHYLQPPGEGPVQVDTNVEREGRSMSNVSARLLQDGTVVAIALGAFSAARSAPEYSELSAPEVPGAAAVPSSAVEGAPPHVHLFDSKPVIGTQPFSGGDEALSGGWLRLLEPQTADAAAMVAYADAWMPAVFSRVQDRVGVPTVDLSVHFRADVPLEDAAPEDHYLVVFRSPVASGGFLVEDGEIWSPRGQLVAQSRQLAAMLPVS